jgi:CrcB protein
MLGIILNSFFPPIPFGTLSANLLGGFLMGIFMALSKGHSYFPDFVRIGITTGFLGGLTTFSTFSAEITTLLLASEFFLASFAIILHAGGSILFTMLGIYLVKFLTSWI